LPAGAETVDIHCATRWSKRSTRWRGVSVDTLLSQVEHDEQYVMAFCDSGYSTSLAMADITGGRAWLAFCREGGVLDAEHGGPPRLDAPRLYFRKASKWVRGLELMDHDVLGCQETCGHRIDGSQNWQFRATPGDVRNYLAWRCRGSRPERPLLAAARLGPRRHRGR
jgi:DMSO/TMAO reductase YedYZ molybdopterin-dependent catalytic subunit